MPYSLEFKLKQHTPLIHFQADDPDATLRATEVKPKLDAFLIEKLTLKHCKQNSWLVGNGEHPALDFKMHITICERGSEETRKGFPVIIPPEKKKSIKDNFLTLKIFSFYEDLVSEIESRLCEFFAFENFGMRQNKGWGSFSAGKTAEDAEDIEKFIEVLKNSPRIVYQKDRKIPEGFGWDKFILSDWQLIKTGKNFPKTEKREAVYKKSLLFQFMAEQGNIRWEKRHIKKNINFLFLKKDIENDLYYTHAPVNLFLEDREKKKYDYSKWEGDWSDRNTKYDYRYVRALLGLAEHYEFLVGAGYNHAKEKKDLKYHVTVKSDQIERFKAPVTFKVFDNTVFVFAKPIDTNLFNKEVNLTFSQREKEENEIPQKPNLHPKWRKKENKFNTIEGSEIEFPSLFTPKEDEFNLDAFLAWALPQDSLNYSQL